MEKDIQKGILYIKLIYLYYEKYRFHFDPFSFVLIFFRIPLEEIQYGMKIKELITHKTSNNLDDLINLRPNSGPFATILEVKTGNSPIKTFYIPRDRRCSIEKINPSNSFVPPNICVNIKIDDHPEYIKMIRDSGADFTMLSRNTREKYTSKFYNLTVINQQLRPLYFVNEMHVNGTTFENVIVNETNMDNCIGQDISSCCIITENYQIEKCEFKPFTTKIKYQCPTLQDLGLNKKDVKEYIEKYRNGIYIDIYEIFEKLIDIKQENINMQKNESKIQHSEDEDEYEKIMKELNLI